MTTQIVIIESVIIFIAMLLNLALKPRVVAKLTGYLVVMSAVIGFLFYGYGFSQLYNNLFLAGLRTTFAMCRMFLGYNEISEMSQLPFFRQNWVLIILWVAHITAFYAFASTAISLLGKKLLWNLYRFRSRFHDLTLIYGLNRESVSFALYMSKEQNDSVIVIDEQPETNWTDELRNAGCLVYADEDAVQANLSFLKRHGIRQGKKKIALYALHDDEAKSIHYIRLFTESIRVCGVKPEQTRLSLWSADEEMGARFLSLENQYGFGTVNVFHRRDVAARLMIRHYPPAAFMQFDENGRAKEDFEALIIGFGLTGQEVLKKLIMNAQFEGSTSHIIICADEAERMSGSFFFLNQPLLESYDVQFIDEDARSRQMYEWLLQHKPSLNYVVIATGDEQMNGRLELELSAYLEEIESRAVVVQCSSGGVRRFDRAACRYEVWETFTPEILYDTQIDRMAIIVNDAYDPDNKLPKEKKWYALDYFSRLSCRAYADFIPQMLICAGLSEENVRKPDFTFEKPVLETLARTEHLRWCAFHYCMGYRKMDDREFEQRTKTYLSLTDKEKESYRVAKNANDRTHACLVDWDELAVLSEKETHLTGVAVDYQEKDVNNILMIPHIVNA